MKVLLPKNFATKRKTKVGWFYWVVGFGDTLRGEKGERVKI